MKKSIVGTVLGVVGVCLWFMPLAYVRFMDSDGYQAGNHIGGIAYLMVLAFLAYTVLSWNEQHVPRIIAASVALAISILFLVQAGSAAAWGLYGLILVSGGGMVVAFRDNTPPKDVQN